MPSREEMIAWACNRLRRGESAGRAVLMRAFGLIEWQARQIAAEARRRVQEESGELDENKQLPLDEARLQIEFGNHVFLNLKKDRVDMGELLDRMIDFQHQLRACNEEQEVLNVVVQTDKPILLAVRGDWHLCSVFCDHERWLEDCRLIVSRPYIKSIEAGDLLDFGILARMPDLVQEQLASAKIQRQLLWYTFKRLGLKDHCLALLTGQHTNWGKAQADFDPIEWLAHDLKLPFLGWGGVLNLQVGKQLWKIVMRHSYSFNSRLNVTHSPKQLLRMGPYGFADIAIVADVHTYAVEVCDLGGRATAILRPGTYKYTDAFSQRKGYNPAKPYMPGVLLWPDRRTFLVAENFRRLLPIAEVMQRSSLAKDERFEPDSCLFESAMEEANGEGQHKHRKEGSD